MVEGAWKGFWNWRIPPRGMSLDELCTLETALTSLSLCSNHPDRWRWKLSANGEFTVKKLSDLVQARLLGETGSGAYYSWNRLVP